MSPLIEGFKREHTEIIAALNKVEGLGIFTEEGWAKLKSVKESLLAHLKKEDVLLYPVLKNEAKSSMGMEDVSKIVQEFFDKNDIVIDMKCEDEFEDLLESLNERIMNEEDVLYEEYEK